MNILDYFRIEECVSWISENKFEKVALQFPENLFKHVVQVVMQLKLGLPLINFVVLADAKYGSCCVDEIACEHAQVSGVIHFGHACLSQISRQNLKVKYVFGNENFNENKFGSYLHDRLFKDDQIILFVDVVYLHAQDKIKACISEFTSNIICPEIILPNNTNNTEKRTDEIFRCCSNNTTKYSSVNDINDPIYSNLNSNQTKNNVQDDFSVKYAGANIQENVELDNKNSNNPILFNSNDNISDEIFFKNCYVKASNQNMKVQCKNNKFDIIQDDNVIFNSKIDNNLISIDFIKFGRLFKLDPSTKFCDYTILYIGAENEFLKIFMMTFSKCKFLVFDPKMDNLDNMSHNVNKMLMKRYYLVEKARDSKFIGILIGTLNVSYYTSIVNKLKQVIKRAGKKCRIYAPGTPNVAKLANVSEFDIFVVVACPENSIIDCSDYLQPIVTPLEMILACQVDFKWLGKYEVDFPRLCQLADDTLKFSSITSITDVSLISGKMINFENEVIDNDSNGRQLVVQNQSLIISESHLNERTFQGLDPLLGETSVKKFIIGATGVATGYTHETIL